LKFFITIIIIIIIIIIINQFNFFIRPRVTESNTMDIGWLMISMPVFGSARGIYSS
jgi:hypothetical protein